MEKWLKDTKLDVNGCRDEKDGGTALHWAAWHGNLDIARLLLERGASMFMQISTLWINYVFKSTVQCKGNKEYLLCSDSWISLVLVRLNCRFCNPSCISNGKKLVKLEILLFLNQYQYTITLRYLCGQVESPMWLSQFEDKLRLTFLYFVKQ